MLNMKHSSQYIYRIWVIFSQEVGLSVTWSYLMTVLFWIRIAIIRTVFVGILATPMSKGLYILRHCFYSS